VFKHEKKLHGRIRLGGDKSLSHRALMFAALAEGKSVVANLSRGADVASTRSVLAALGVGFDSRGYEFSIESRGLRNFTPPRETLYCGNSGTTLRLMLGILAGSNLKAGLSGDASLNRRPVIRVITPLSLMGADIRTATDKDTPPVLVEGRQLHGITYQSPVASAQVKSAVLLAGLTAEGVTEYSEPSLSRDHTERFLRSQGVDISSKQSSVTLKPPGKITPFSYAVPGDVSTAAFLVIAALLMPGSNIVVENLLLNETRTGAIELLRRMGASVRYDNTREYFGEEIGDLVVESSSLRGVDTQGVSTPSFIDEVPILAVAAMFAEGRTTIRDIGELRVKESDRAQGIVDILQCYGCEAAIEGSDLIIEGGYKGRSAFPSHHDDHRLAMSIEVIDLVISGEMGGDFSEAISISAPEFYGIFKSVITK